jgi:hypothetical protein
MPYTLNPNGYINPTSTSDSGHVEVDPSAPGTVMRGALAFEAMANAIGGTWMVFFPQRFLNLLVSSPMQITGAAVTWTQLTGSLVYALATPVILGIPNSRRGIESRAPTYYTLAAGEVGRGVLCWLCVRRYFQLWRGGSMSCSGDPSGLVDIVSCLLARHSRYNSRDSVSKHYKSHPPKHGTLQRIKSQSTEGNQLESAITHPTHLQYYQVDPWPCNYY